MPGSAPGVTLRLSGTTAPTRNDERAPVPASAPRTPAVTSRDPAPRRPRARAHGGAGRFEASYGRRARLPPRRSLRKAPETRGGSAAGRVTERPLSDAMMPDADAIRDLWEVDLEQEDLPGAPDAAGVGRLGAAATRGLDSDRRRAGGDGLDLVRPAPRRPDLARSRPATVLDDLGDGRLPAGGLAPPGGAPGSHHLPGRRRASGGRAVDGGGPPELPWPAAPRPGQSRRSATAEVPAR